MSRFAGKMDRRLTFRVKTTTRGAAGGTADTWANVATVPTVWAQKLDESSREFRAAAALHSEVSIVFRVRYRSDITSKHRITFDGRTYEILGEPVEEGRKDTLLISAKYTEGRA